jgi:hypothetical protein
MRILFSSFLATEILERLRQPVPHFEFKIIHSKFKMNSLLILPFEFCLLNWSEAEEWLNRFGNKLSQKV